MKLSDVRFREDVGWELQCKDCHRRTRGASYWPITHEFWNPKNMARCRSCQKELKRQRERENESRKVYMAAYRIIARDAIAITQREYDRTHAERVRLNGAVYRLRHRDEVNAKARARYHRRMAALRQGKAA